MISVALLESLGVENLKEGTKEITGRCPMHPQILGRSDRHASWSINKETGAHICFSCGWRGGLWTLYHDLTGEVPSDIDAELTAAKLRLEDRKDEEDEVEWRWEDDDLVEVPERLLAIRHLTSDSAKAYGVLWDPDRKMWVLPMTTPSGEIHGVQYRQKGNEINQPTGIDKSQYLFGLPTALSSSAVVLVESPLDCLRFHQIGVAAVSSFGAHVSVRQLELLNRHFNLVVLALDNDEAGQRSSDRVSERLRSLGCPVILFRYGTVPYKDPGDFETDEELKDSWDTTMALCRP